EREDVLTVPLAYGPRDSTGRVIARAFQVYLKGYISRYQRAVLLHRQRHSSARVGHVPRSGSRTGHVGNVVGPRDPSAHAKDHQEDTGNEQLLSQVPHESQSISEHWTERRSLST